MRRLFSLLICAVATTGAFAQETNCTNGLDDDNDGFIDCYDSDCALNSACDDIFIGNDATCTLTPPPAPAFTMKLDFSSADETTNHFSRIVIGDLDRDGTPEIVTMNKYTKKLIILNGNGGAIKYQAVMANGAEPEWELATANINNDNCAEIFFLTSGGSPAGERNKIYVYDCQLNFLYSTPSMPGNNDPINFGIADFGGDGKSEIYCKDEIFDAHTGTRLRATTLSGANWGSVLNGGPTAVNMDADPELELVLGLTIYNVTIPASRAANSATLTVMASRPEYFVRNDYNATSVADFNQDGNMDVIASGSAGCNFSNTTIFFWDVFNNKLRTYCDNAPKNVDGDSDGDNDYEDGWQNGTGRVNIADLDGDGQLNASYVSGGYLYALKEDLTLLWRKVVKEETSGYTGCTLFDFNGDGKSEVVYRDEQSIYIIDGTDGSTFNSQPCISRTNREYPIVADVDADGSTEICVTCGFDDVAAQANFYTTNYSRYSHVRVFSSAADPWVPARRVWNQHGYFVVNINDDLSVPIQQQLHSKTFSTTACRPGDPVGPVRPLNKFLNQSPFIDTNGCPAYLAPDLDYATAVTFIPPTCPGLDFQVNFTITNRGEVSLSGNIPVTFYDSNPLKPGANPIATLIFPISDLDRNQLFVISETITSNGSDSLFVVLNDAGTTVPTPISLPNTPYLECNYDNVRGIAISPLPVAITAMEVTPNELCAAPPTGSMRAFVPMGGGVENTADYDFYWFKGAVAKPIANADFIGPIYTGVVDGVYTVFAIHKTASCSSDTAQVVVNPAPGILPLVTVTKISDQTNCNPPNGSLQASIAGGNSGYTFSWEDIAAPIGVTGPLLTGQSSGTYTVIVTHTVSGCQTSADGTIGDLTQEPDVVATATPVTNCANLLSGTVSAEAFLGGVAQPDASYVFDWYFYDNVAGVRGSLLPPIHGAVGTPDRTGLPVGFYEVQIKQISTGCQGPVTAKVQVADQRVIPVVQITQLTPQTSCDPANPNGRLQANVSMSGSPQPPNAFTFAWFVGQNTLPANAHTFVSGTNGSVAEKVKGGGQSYTVKVTTVDQCVGTDDDVVIETLSLPVVTLTPSPNGICDPALASSNFTGSVTASVTFAGGPPLTFPNPNYSFKWYNGTQAVGAPLAQTSNVLPQLDSGYYTVVVTRTDLGCAAAPETEFVNNITVLPVILIESDSSTNCTPLALGVTPNGRGVVKKVDTVNPNPATHTFLWHTGINTSTPIVGATNPILPSLQGGVGKFFTVLVTNKSNGCKNTSTVEIPDAQEKPVITLLPTDNSICDPVIAGTSRNGSVLIQTVTYKGSAFAGARTNQWFNGVGTGTPNASSTTATLPNLAAGFYSATVKLTATGCTADFVSAEVKNALVLPAILTTPKPSTNCVGGAPNGDIAAAVNVAGVPTTAGFSFKWFTGIAITDPAVPNSPNNGNTAHAIQLQGGQDFTVEATNLGSGCKNTSTLTLLDDSKIPVITPLSFTPNLNCTAPFSGTATVNAATPFTYRGTTITNPYAGFTLTWSGGTPNAAGDQVTALAAGTYTLQVKAGTGNTVTSNNDNCISNPVQVTILDNLTYPVINIAKVNQTSCDLGAPNGILTATVGGGTAGHIFKWFSGVGIIPPAVDITDPGTPNVIDNLVSNDYTSFVVNSTTRCESSQTIFLPDNIVNPSISFTNVNDVTACAPPNGSVRPIVTGVSPMPNTDFTIFYVKTFSDAANPGTPPSSPAVIKASLDQYPSTSAVVNGTNPPDVLNLMPGYITGLVVDNFTKCESTPATVQIIDATIANQINVGVVTAAGFCGGVGGSINITAAGGAGGYVYNWYSGTPSNTNINFFNNPPDMTAATFVTNTEDLGVITPAGGVGAGTYTLVVTDAVGCGTYVIDNVGFAGAPVITVTPTDPQKCVAPFDGQVNVTVAGAAGPYSIAIYNGNNPVNPSVKGEICDDGLDNDGDGLTDGADPDCGVVNITATNLSSGQYLIHVIDYAAANRPCPLDQGVVLTQQAFAPLVTIDAINPNTACDVAGGADGSIDLTVSMDAQDPRDPVLTPISFEVLNVSAPLLTPPLFPSALSSGVATVSTTLNYGFGPQTYTVTINEVSSGCQTIQSVTVPNQPVIPVLGQANVAITNDSFCAPNSNGSALATPVSPAALTDYRFDWFSDAGLTTLIYQDNGGAAAPNNGELFNNTKTGYLLGALGQGIGTQTYYVRAEILAGRPGAGCPSPAVQVIIQDAHVTPVLTLSSSPDTSCDPVIGEGSVSVTTVTNSPAPAVQNALYNYSINPDPNAVGLLINQNGALSTPFIRLTDATYNVTALNQISACPINKNVTILPALYNISITDTLQNDKLICRLDGDITATEITIDRSLTSLSNQVFSTPLNANFEFRWFKGAPGAFVSATALVDGTTTVISTEGFVIGNGLGQFNDPAPTLGAGTYYVVARQLTGPGKFGAFCESVPLRVEILDKSKTPIAALDPTTDTSCNGPFEGSISVLVTDSSPIPGPFNYNYTWTALTAGRTAPGPITNPYNGNNNLFSLVEDGLYELTALNNQTGCSSVATQTTVSKTAVPIVVANATHADQLICNPDGSIRVVDVTVSGVIDPTHNNFNFLWYRNAVVGGTELVPFNPPSGNDVLDVVDLPATIGAGTYFVKAQRVLGLPFGSGCESAPFRVDILDKSVDPDLDFTFQPNSSCNPANPNGVVNAIASERDLTTDNYTFVWTYNSGALPGVTTQTDATPNSQLTNAFEGDYILRVTNTLTGCRYNEGLALDLDLSISLPNIVDVATINPVNCFPTGSADVRSITIGGTTTFSKPADNLDLLNFDYEWFSGSVPAGIIAGQTTSVLLNRLPGTYYVSVEDLRTNCTSSLVEVFIDPATIVYPVVAIQQTAPQASCNAAFGTGVLASTADGQTDANPNYTFTWFPTVDLTGTSFSNTSTVTGLFSGGYSVSAFNALTNCSASALFIVPVDSLEFLPQLELTGSPLTECDSIDGSVFIRGLQFPVTANLATNYPFPYNYTADLYVGAPPANIAAPEFPNVPNDPNNPSFTESFLQPNLVDGLYTVRLTDNNTGCITIDTVSVKDARIFPKPTITEIAPVTNCDPARPNGVARALVNGSFNGYSFEWYEGSAVTPPLLYTGAQYDKLKPTPVQYTVHATNLVTGCTGDVQGTISNGQKPVPSPDIKVVSQVTSCVENNGALSVSVGGNTKDYIFDWFAPPPSFIGSYYDSLAIGTYSVIATSKITGCVSPPTSEDVISDPVYPGLDFVIEAATCGQNDGSATLSIVSSVAIQSVIWFDINGTQIEVGPGLNEVYAGTYSVNVTTILGCESKEEIKIDTEIRPRNFISRNGDDSNSYFHIDCIENFTIDNGAPHDNIVKIFNRVGTLVYQMEGYDNVDIYFNGKSNKGIGTNLMGTDLPDGTYFFIVDKRDGSKPTAGYLEIVK